MRKLFISSLIIASLSLIVGCKSDNKKVISNNSVATSSTSSSENKLVLSEKEYDSLVGTWECIDPGSLGDEVYISKADNGLSIQYDGEEKTNTELTSKSKEVDCIYYHFENKKDEMAYMIDLKSNGNIILNRGTTNPEMTGLSKPMEYKRISE